MEQTFYVANLVPTTTDEQLRAIFEPVGTVLEARMLIHPKTEKPTGGALVKLEIAMPPMELIAQLNGQVIEGRRLAVSLAKPEFPLPKATPEQKALASEIAEKLGETDAAPCRQILRLVRVCGEKFAQSVLTDALEVESAGGLMVLDGSRRRTQGGVFFYLARGRMSYDVQGVIFPRGKPKKKTEQNQPDQSGEQNQKSPKTQKKNNNQGQNNAKVPRKAAEGTGQPAEEKVSAAPPPDLDELRTQLKDLRKAHQEAQDNLTALQEQKGTKSVGTFSAIKQVFELQRQIDDLLKTYPQLR